MIINIPLNDSTEILLRIRTLHSLKLRVLNACLTQKQRLTILIWIIMDKNFAKMHQFDSRLKVKKLTFSTLRLSGIHPN